MATRKPKVRATEIHQQGLAIDVEERIRLRAYELFELRGGGHGYDLDDWLQAEAQLMGEASDLSAAAKPKRERKGRPKAATKSRTQKSKASGQGSIEEERNGD